MSERNGHGHFAKGNKIGPRWKKGQSGLPGGHWVARIREIRKLAQDETEASFRVLFEIRDNKTEDSRNRIAACKEIIRYGIGEPKPLEKDADEQPTENDALTLDELRSLARQSLEEERELDDDDDSDDDSDTSTN